MKVFYFLVFYSFTIQAQTIDHILFEYDTAGNQIKRYTIDINPGRPSQEVKEIDDLVEDDLKRSDLYDDIRYYPNPLKTELYVKWENLEGLNVNYIEVYSVNGQRVYKNQNLKEHNSTVISFESLQSGLYTVILYYSDNSTKNLKVIKN